MKAGEKLKFSKRKSKMASTTNKANSRDWGRGMACIGRTTECTLVRKDHYGPIPGVDVGTCWKFRVQVSTVSVVHVGRQCKRLPTETCWKHQNINFIRVFA